MNLLVVEAFCLYMQRKSNYIISLKFCNFLGAKLNLFPQSKCFICGSHFATKVVINNWANQGVDRGGVESSIIIDPEIFYLF